MTARPMRHAGTFYPECPATTQAVAAAVINSGRDSFGSPLAIVAPHAGWRFCAPVLGTAFRASANRKNISRIIHLGPSHYHTVTGIVRDSAERYETPLGSIETDQSKITGIPLDQAVHADEHALEVQLPLIRLLFPEVTLLPLITGSITPKELAGILHDLGCGEDDSLTIISSDLSHYLAREEARNVDLSTLATVERLDAETLSLDQACGAAALSGLLYLAREKHWKTVALDRRDSFDIAETDQNSVVGYGAFAFYSREHASADFGKIQN